MTSLSGKKSFLLKVQNIGSFLTDVAKNKLKIICAADSFLLFHMKLKQSLLTIHVLQKN
jgi:hypothetical protein